MHCKYIDLSPCSSCRSLEIIANCTLYLAPCTLYIATHWPQVLFPRCTTDKLVPDVVPPQKRREKRKNMCSCFQMPAFPTLLIFRFSQNCFAGGLFTNLNILRGNNEFSLLVHIEKLRKCDEALKTL